MLRYNFHLNFSLGGSRKRSVQDESYSTTKTCITKDILKLFDQILLTAIALRNVGTRLFQHRLELKVASFFPSKINVQKENKRWK